jgi:type IV secretory pathway TrbD component
MENKEVKGFEIPIHRSLTEPILMAGVPRTIALLNGTLAAILLLGLHSWYGLPVCIILHFVAVYAAKKDPLFFDVFKRQMNHKSYYDV